MRHKERNETEVNVEARINQRGCIGQPFCFSWERQMHCSSRRNFGNNMAVLQSPLALVIQASRSMKPTAAVVSKIIAGCLKDYIYFDYLSKYRLIHFCSENFSGC